MIRFSALRTVGLFSTLAILTTQTACLKTRAQLKEDGDEPVAVSAPVPVKQDPQAPQGGYVIDEMKGEITRLEGRLQDLERSQKQQTSGGAGPEDFKKLETRVTELEQAQVNMLEAIKKMQESGPVTADPAELLKKGLNQVEAGNVEGSIEAFSSCIKVAKGKVAEDCTFHRGESHFTLKDYKKAIVDYSKFPEKYTRSSYMPKALYRIGLSFEALGMKDDAKGFYQELVEKFPKSPEAKKARSKAK